MNHKKKTYIAIDLKSFYASVECVERGLDPLNTNLVVADSTRTEKTICLAVSPSLKSYGIPGRARLFEVVQKVNEVNKDRFRASGLKEPEGESVFADELKQNKSLAVSYITATPRMALYMEYSTRIFEMYMRYIAPEDIHVYSVDEVFMDVTAYLGTYKLSARELAMKMIKEVLDETGITATAGIGTNLYLCKIAMDIEAKHIPADENGVRIAELDEQSYRTNLWPHKPITDFWRVGPGIAKKLAEYGMYTMGDVARCSLGKSGDLRTPELLYKLFGINAELLIDHAWGYEPVEISDIKSYRPESNSLSTGQVLSAPYDFQKTKLIIREMTELLVLDLVDKQLLTDQMVINIGYDINNLTLPEIAKAYKGEVTSDHYGRKIPKPAHGSINLSEYTSSTKVIVEAVIRLFEQTMDPRLYARRLNVVANRIIPEGQYRPKKEYEQLDIFTDYHEIETERSKIETERKKEKQMQKAIISLQKKYGKNAVLKGMNLEEGATSIERNQQIGGHKA